MMTSEHKVTCPECRVVNDYEIQKMELIDNDLHVTYMCVRLSLRKHLHSRILGRKNRRLFL